MNFNCEAQNTSLSDLQWKNRFLLVFVESNENPKMLLQQSFLEKATKDYLERDLLVFFVEEKNIVNFQKIQFNENPQLLRKKFQVQSNEFCIVLIGKDGGEKFRTSDILTNEKLFAIIDAMPMRRNEMRKNE